MYIYEVYTFLYFYYYGMCYILWFNPKKDTYGMQVNSTLLYYTHTLPHSLSYEVLP
jgi:hypothetical protein